MNVIEYDKNGRIRLVTYNPIEILRRWFNRDAKPCVVCGVPTKHILHNSYTGLRDYVHHPDDPDSIGCKQVWRYWRDSADKISKEEFLALNAENIAEGWIDLRDYSDDDFWNERDGYNDYRSYIASKEWEIKSYFTKQAAGWQCEKCGRGGNKSTLHLHHKHYKTLYKERRRDVEVLCEKCHAKRHGK
jgi:hypothetical protein